MLVYLGRKENKTDYYVVEIETPDQDVGGAITEENVAVQSHASGFIYGGTVKKIRKYTFNFTTRDFVTAYTEETTRDFVSETGPFIETISFTVDAPISITRSYMRRGTVYEGPVLSSFEANAADVVNRQRNYFTRTSTTDLTIAYETQTITGSRRLDIYGSFDRTLRELRHTIFPSVGEIQAEVKVGTYYLYHPNGNVRSIYTYKNPTLTGDSLLDGDYYEYYEDGSVKVSARFSDNFLNGLYKQFYPNGFLQTNCLIVNGKLDGQYNQFTREGNRDYIAFFVNGTLDNSYVLNYLL